MDISLPSSKNGFLQWVSVARSRGRRALQVMITYVILLLLSSELNTIWVTKLETYI
jgi:hypothetical protein